MDSTLGSWMLIFMDPTFPRGWRASSNVFVYEEGFRREENINGKRKM
jgi:hypothetical protein